MGWDGEFLVVWIFFAGKRRRDFLGGWLNFDGEGTLAWGVTDRMVSIRNGPLLAWFEGSQKGWEVVS